MACFLVLQNRAVKACFAGKPPNFPSPYNQVVWILVGKQSLNNALNTTEAKI